MKRLNRNEVAKLINMFARVTKHAEIHERKWLGLLGKDTERAMFESDYHREAEKYWNLVLSHTDMRLAEMGIFVNGEESKNILANWDDAIYQARWRKQYDAYQHATAEWEGYKAEQEQEESTGAVA